MTFLVVKSKYTQAISNYSTRQCLSRCHKPINFAIYCAAYMSESQLFSKKKKSSKIAKLKSALFLQRSQ